MKNAEQTSKDEVDLIELFSKLWAFKIFIFVSTCISLSIGIIYLSQAEKIYTSSTTFLLEDTSKAFSSNIFGSQIGSLGGLIGLDTGNSSASTTIERITARDFVLEVNNELNLRNDKFFNNYDPNYSDPIWKALIKSILNWKTTPRNPDKVADWNVLNGFKKHIEITKTDTGAITVSANHPDADRAAEIANHIAIKTINLTKKETLDNSNEQISYLSQKLADSLISYENAETRLKNFALLNSTASLASFNAGSIILDDLRSQRETSETQIETIDVLLSITKRAPPTHQDYLTLRREYRLLDQSDFRRTLGISEVLSAWSWPSVEKLSRVRESIYDRVGALNSKIFKLEDDAKKYAQSAEEMNKLRRELRIEESTYKLLTEQVKALSLRAGFTPEMSKIIAAADIPISSSKPKPYTIVGLAAIFGFVGSSLLAVILSFRTGFCYSEGSLLRLINPVFIHKTRSLRRYRSNNLKAARENLNKHSITWLRQVLLESIATNTNQCSFIIDTTSSHYASTISRLLGVSAYELGLNIAYIDLTKWIHFDTSKQYKENISSEGDMIVSETIEGCTEYDYAYGKQNIDLFFSKSFKNIINHLNTRHDAVLMSGDTDILNILHPSRLDKGMNLIVHLSKGKTKFETIDELNKKGNVEVAILT